MAGGVKYLRHLTVVGAVGVATKGCMGVFVFEGLGLVLAASAALSVRGGRSRKYSSVVIEVPGRRGKLVPGRQVVEQIGGMCSVGRSQIEDWSSSARSSLLFMLSRGWRL